MRKGSDQNKVPKTGIRKKRTVAKTKNQTNIEELHFLGLSSLPIRLPMDKIRVFCKKHHVIYLGLFGSVLTDRFTKKSDVDFLVEFDDNHYPSLFSMVDIEEELAIMIRRRVDLKTPGDLSRYFRAEVIANAKRIYGQQSLDSVQAHVGVVSSGPKLHARKKAL